MVNTDFVYTLIRGQYDYAPTHISPLHHFPISWRGIYRVDFDNGLVGVLRLIRNESTNNGFEDVAHILQILEDLTFPAPRVLQTRYSNLASDYDGWSGLLTTYIPGNILNPSVAEIVLLTELVAALHNVKLPTNAPRLPDSRWSLARIRATKSCLQNQAHDLSGVLAEIIPSLIDSLEFLEKAVGGLSFCLVHGDAWYMNAVKNDETTTLIDWDTSGMGFAMCELAYLLLTSHYQRNFPLEVIADTEKVQSMIGAYQQRRRISASEWKLLVHCMRFCLAEGIARADDAVQNLLKDKIALSKLEARYNATGAIGEVVKGMLESV